MSVGAAQGGMKRILEQSEEPVDYFKKLTKNTLSKIFGTHFDTLTKIALVSKDFRKLVWENSPIWQGFCKEAGLAKVDNESYREIFMCALADRNIKANQCFSDL